VVGVDGARANAATRRQELATLLRTRRGQLDRAELGVPVLARSRTSGLRREEVAALSGVSVTWYTWLEQGRDISPSRQVVDALARTLRLSPAERGYALSLAGYAPPDPETPPGPVLAPPPLQRLLDQLAGSPAFVLTRGWDIAGWNAAYAALYPGVATVHPADRNLLGLVFTDPFVRRLLPDWAEDSRRFLAEFRAEVGTHLGDPGVAAVVERLLAASPEFLAGWTNHDIEGFTSRERRFHHPRVGDLTLEQHKLTPADQPALSLIVYTPVQDGTTPGRLSQLLAGPVEDPAEGPARDPA